MNILNRKQKLIMLMIKGLQDNKKKNNHKHFFKF